MKFTKKNLRNIKCVFEEKTGTDLNPAHRNCPGYAHRKVLVLAVILTLGLLMAAFSYPLFTPLDGDELSLTGAYEGNGIVTIYVENRLDKDLKFQKQTKLMRWVTSEEVERLGGDVTFGNTEFKAHTSGTMIVDLSKAYDVEALEQADTSDEWYYLLLTNNGFLFGHDWMCSITFGGAGEETGAIEETRPHVAAAAENVEEVEEALRFYFEDAYGDELLSFNGANFQYQQKVEEVLTRFQGNVVPSMSPTIMVGGPSQFLDPEPVFGRIPDGVIFDDSVPAEQQYLLSYQEWTYTDGYGRMVASSDEKAMTQVAMLPQYQGQTDGGVAIPLIFLFVYDAEAAADPENYAFIYGQLHSFEDLEQYKVFTDEHYAIYDATDLIYTDVDAYLDYFLATREDIYCDEQIRERVHRIYDFYQDKETVAGLICYLELEG